jgi:hypothetical protein
MTEIGPDDADPSIHCISGFIILFNNRSFSGGTGSTIYRRK